MRHPRRPQSIPPRCATAIEEARFRVTAVRVPFGPDAGQPTQFYPRRNRFVVWVSVPKVCHAMLYAFGFIGLFTIGGLTGLFLGTLGTDIHLTDTYFVVAHFHYVMVGGMVMAFLGGLHFWWPKITGRLYPEGWAKFAPLLVFAGFNCTFFPQFILGYLGQPRRYHAYAPEFQVLNAMSTAGASSLGLGYVLPMIYFLWSLKYGPKAGNNPWNAKGLEWQTASPPRTFNFEETPIVTEEAYAYAGPHEDVQREDLQ